MRFTIVTSGALRAAWRIQGLGIQADNNRPAMEEIYAQILEIEDEIFESQGTRGGRAGWAPLTVPWMDYKRDHEPPFDWRILHMTKLLRDSVTRWRHPMQYTRIEKHKIVFRSQRPYADAHQKGSKKAHIPKREFVYFTRADAHAFAAEIKRHVMSPIGAGPPASA